MLPRQVPVFAAETVAGEILYVNNKTLGGISRSTFQMCSSRFATAWKNVAKSRDTAAEAPAPQEAANSFMESVGQVSGSQALPRAYAGTVFSFSFGIIPSVSLLIPRWAITNSGGVWVTQSESEKSWYWPVLNISRKIRSVSPVFSM